MSGLNGLLTVPYETCSDVAHALIAFAIAFACAPFPKEVETSPTVKVQRFPAESFDSLIDEHADSLMEQGRKVFRYDSLGSESFWGDKLKLHEAIAGEKQGGVGPGLNTIRNTFRHRLCSTSIHWRSSSS
jgi:hypothetical protein